MTPTSKSVLKSNEASSDPLVGQTLGGKYAIVRLIGRGGVGLVYHARQLDLGRDVVVKVLSPHWATDNEALARFEREAKRLAGLHHPNIVDSYDFGREGDRAYLVMEYLAGELLSEHVSRKKRLTLEEFVPIAAQLLKGIGHAHSREVMVRDVKPANVMLCERKGRANFVKLLDFGLAKLLRGEQAITEEHVMGTVGYLAPEAIRGEAIDCGSMSTRSAFSSTTCSRDDCRSRASRTRRSSTRRSTRSLATFVISSGSRMACPTASSISCISVWRRSPTTDPPMPIASSSD